MALIHYRPNTDLSGAQVHGWGKMDKIMIRFLLAPTKLSDAKLFVRQVSIGMVSFCVVRASVRGI